MIFKNTHDEARWLYAHGLSDEHIARLLRRNVRTISNYRTADGDWDELRFKELIKDKDGKPLYDNFKLQMQRGIDEINDSCELGASEKAAAIAKLADAYAKMRKVAEIEDPTKFKLNVARAVIGVFMKEVAALCDERLNERFKDFLSSGQIEKALEREGLL